ncbi:RNA polymerase sigma factor [compost metagenome]
MDEAVADPAPLADATMISRQEIAALKRALDALPPRCREVLFLHKFEGLSYQETASRLGISKNTVMVHMVNALGQLRARMREENDLSK